MALPDHLRDREYKKFVADAAGDTCVRVKIADIIELTSLIDDLEPLITATNTLLTTIRDNADQIEGFLDQVEGFVDGLETTLTAIDGRFFASTAALTNVASSASSTTLLAANSSRKGFVLYNDSNKDAFVKFGATASSTSFTIFMNAGATLVSTIPIYRGQIDCIWTSANGNMRVTEMT